MQRTNCITLVFQPPPFHPTHNLFIVFVIFGLPRNQYKNNASAWTLLLDNREKLHVRTDIHKAWPTYNYKVLRDPYACLTWAVTQKEACASCFFIHWVGDDLSLHEAAECVNPRITRSAIDLPRGRATIYFLHSSMIVRRHIASCWYTISQAARAKIDIRITGSRWRPFQVADHVGVVLVCSFVTPNLEEVRELPVEDDLAALYGRVCPVLAYNLSVFRIWRGIAAVPLQFMSQTKKKLEIRQPTCACTWLL